MIKSLKRRIVERWDWWIYHRAGKSLRRLHNANGGFVYLLELRLRRLREDDPLPKSVENATERFFETLTKSKN